MEGEGEFREGFSPEQENVDIESLETTVYKEYGHLSALRNSESLNNRVEGSVIYVGKIEEGLREKELSGEEVTPGEKLGFKLTKTLAFWSARRIGWTDFDIQDSVKQGHGYAKREMQLAKLTGKTGFEVWSEKKIFEPLARQSLSRKSKD